jgi:hypothetical protein
MRTINKYQLLKTLEEQEFAIPAPAHIIHAGRDPYGDPYVWALVDPERETVKKIVRLRPDGEPLDFPIGAPPVSSFILGDRMTHVFVE